MHEDVEYLRGGILVRVVKELTLPDGSIRVVVRGIKRIVFKEFVPNVKLAESVTRKVRYTVLDDGLGATTDPELLGYFKSIQVMFQEYAAMAPGMPEEVSLGAMNAPNVLRLSDMVAEALSLSITEKRFFLAVPSLKKRCELLAGWLNRELIALRLGMKIQNEVQINLGESQREFYLREQLRVIKNELGEDFSLGEVFVPEMLRAANCMSAATDILKPLLAGGNGGGASGRVCLGTVRGDLHDIGKNLVKIMMEGSGLEVIDLGCDVCAEDFIQSAMDNKCDIIACSTLLTTSMGEIKRVVDLANESGIHDKVKILIGGAPVTQEYCEQVGADMYTPDAAAAARAAVQMMEV
jgi:methanogenic corrinoid protein MtbC1